MLRVRQPQLAAVTSTTYTLIADGGTYSYSGNNANTLFGRRVAADGGTYSYTGNNANTLFGRRVAADGGTYSYSGNNSDLIFVEGSTYTLDADGGTYSYAGNSVNIPFEYVSASTMAGTASAAVFVNRRTPASSAMTGAATVTAIGRLKWEAEPDTAESWSAVPDTAESWAAASDTAKTWTEKTHPAYLEAV